MKLFKNPSRSFSRKNNKRIRKQLEYMEAAFRSQYYRNSNHKKKPRTRKKK